MATVITALISETIEALLEIDETYHEVLPDGRLKVVFVTTGVHPDVAKIKTALWALSAPPIQKVDDVKVEVVQKGPVLKRYRITVVLSPIVKGVRRDKSIGFREALGGEVVDLTKGKPYG
jgi:hypothetical protein